MENTQVKPYDGSYAKCDECAENETCANRIDVTPWGDSSERYVPDLDAICLHCN